LLVITIRRKELLQGIFALLAHDIFVDCFIGVHQRLK
jgi:hypothetical protein